MSTAKKLAKNKFVRFGARLALAGVIGADIGDVFDGFDTGGGDAGSFDGPASSPGDAGITADQMSQAMNAEMNWEPLQECASMPIG